MRRRHLAAALVALALLAVPAGAQFFRLDHRISFEHATDCPNNAPDAKARQLCVDLDDGRVWRCEPTAGDCDTAGEWKAVVGWEDSATPSVAFQDSDAAVADDQARLECNLTDTGDGTEDMDCDWQVMVAGALVDKIQIDADGPTNIRDASVGDATNTVGLRLSGDRVFHDTDNDGTKDAGEEFIDQAGGAGTTCDAASISRAAASQSIPSGTATKVAVDTIEYDVGAGIADVTTNDRIDIASAGVYVITAGMDCAGFLDTNEQCIAYIYVNGAAVRLARAASTQTNGFVGPSVTTIENLAANDTVEMYVFQNEGAAWSTSTQANNRLRLSIARLDCGQ